MKKDRDCINNTYPIYTMPYMGPMMPMNNMPMNTPMYDNSIQNQIDSLEKRVSNLEALVSNTAYNNQSFQMM